MLCPPRLSAVSCSFWSLLEPTSVSLLVFTGSAILVSSCSCEVSCLFSSGAIRCVIDICLDLLDWFSVSLRDVGPMESTVWNMYTVIYHVNRILFTYLEISPTQFPLRHLQKLIDNLPNVGFETNGTYLLCWSQCLYSHLCSEWNQSNKMMQMGMSLSHVMTGV